MIPMIISIDDDYDPTMYMLLSQEGGEMEEEPKAGIGGERIVVGGGERSFIILVLVAMSMMMMMEIILISWFMPFLLSSLFSLLVVFLCHSETVLGLSPNEIRFTNSLRLSIFFSFFFHALSSFSMHCCLSPCIVCVDWRREVQNKVHPLTLLKIYSNRHIKVPAAAETTIQFRKLWSTVCSSLFNYWNLFSFHISLEHYHQLSPTIKSWRRLPLLPFSYFCHSELLSPNPFNFLPLPLDL